MLTKHTKSYYDYHELIEVAVKKGAITESYNPFFSFWHFIVDNHEINNGSTYKFCWTELLEIAEEEGNAKAADVIKIIIEITGGEEHEYLVEW